MDFRERMNAALTYIEENLTGEIDYAQAAKQAGCSEYHFSRMFAFLAGQSLSGYIRRRRLSLAALRLRDYHSSLLDLAVLYGYSSVDAFTRAFKELHGLPPSQVQNIPEAVKLYPRITFNLTIQGGQEMTYRIIEKQAFRIIGIKKTVGLVYQGPNPEIDAMWQSLTQEQIHRWKGLSDQEPRGIISASTNFSEDRMEGSGSLDQYIGVATTAFTAPGDAVLEVPESKWAIFESIGPFPETLQTIWGRIYSEWFPSVPYELAPGPEILWNEQPDTTMPQFRSEIWIPVRGFLE